MELNRKPAKSYATTSELETPIINDISAAVRVNALEL